MDRLKPGLQAVRGFMVQMPGHKTVVALQETVIDAEAVAPNNVQQLSNGFGGDGFLRLGEPGGYLFLFCFAFRFPITRLGLTVPFSFHFALDRITADLAIVFGRELVSIDFTGDIEGNLIPLELAL